MDTEIEILKKYIKSTLETSSSNYNNYVLLYFNDPDVSEPLNHPTLDAFINSLNKMKAHNGGDCPEESVLGIERALQNSDSDSVVFVFTDAYAKEGGDTRKIIEICENNNIQVYIFLTGTCQPTSKSSAGDVNVYYDITRSCSGNVLRLIPSNLTQAFRFMKEMVHGEWKDVHTEDKFTGESFITTYIAAYTTEVIIAISGDYLSIEHKNSLDPSNHERIMEGRQIIVERLIRPEEGEHRMRISGRDTTVTIYKQVQFPFKYAFAPRSPLSFTETTSRPIPDALSSVIVEVFDDQVKMKSLQIISMKTGETSSLQLQPGLAKNMFLCEHNFKASEPFKIKVFGYDSSRNIDVTGSTDIIEPQQYSTDTAPLAPKARIVEPASNFVQYRSTVTIACMVSGNPRPNIQWDMDGTILTSQDYLLEYPAQYISYATAVNFKNNATFNCKARNVVDEDYSHLELFVKRIQEFEITQSPQDQTIEFGDEERIHCDVLAYPEATKTWFHNNTEITETDDQYAIMPHYLLIKKMNLDNVGKFKCVVTNEFETKTLSAEITISGLAIPEISLSSEELMVNPGTKIEVECRLLKGLPSPKLSWTFKSEGSSISTYFPGRSYVNKLNLEIDDAKTSDSGTYTCRAENFLEVVEKDVVIKVYYEPVLQTGDEEKTVTVEQPVELECIADGNPKPEIRWEIYRNGHITALESRHELDAYNTLRFVATWEDSGEYKCFARNEIAEKTRTVKLTVLVPPYIATLPSKVIYIKHGDPLRLTCNVLYGNPEPTIEWYFTAVDSTPTLQKRDKRTSTIEIEKVTKQNEGLYKCAAENDVGADRIDIKVIVK